MVVNAITLGPLLALESPTTENAATVKLYSVLGRRPVTFIDNSVTGGVVSIPPSRLRVAVTEYSIPAEEGNPKVRGSSHERTAQVAPVEFTVMLRGSDGGPEIKYPVP